MNAPESETRRGGAGPIEIDFKKIFKMFSCISNPIERNVRLIEAGSGKERSNWNGAGTEMEPIHFFSYRYRFHLWRGELKRIFDGLGWD